MVSYKSYRVIMQLTVTLLCSLAEQVEYVEVMTTEPRFVDITKNASSIWFYQKYPRCIVNAWRSVSVNVDFGDVSDAKYTMMFGDNLTNLREELKNKDSWFWFLRGPDLFQRTALDPFTNSYIGIHSSANYYVSLRIKEFDTFMFGSCLFGLTLYLMANRLSQITATYYACGAMSAVLGSLVVLFIVIGRMMPRRPLSLAFYWCGWGASLYLWSYIKSSIFSYYKWIVCYVVLVSLAAISWIYRWGTPIHFRTKQIFRYAMQIVGAILVYLNCQIRELSISVLAGIVLVEFTPAEAFIMNWWDKLYPPRVKLLTREEFEMQGRLETSKALEELRSFCNSPEFGRWSVLSRLSDPHQFAMFMNGADHLSFLHESEDDFSGPNGDAPSTSSRYSLLEDSDTEGSQ
ncbi:hypothetical protein M514_26294 [Trichuris suis]|uniref:Nuclear envelope integral membrane protein 1 n=1 Tax=Trichuris suis TaxID=68888 RepID=A0A085MWE9_9BILA|nr:hypothetical protein M514_26294 [Trichuris suis]KHJ47523.1 hypothetical protein D918_02383 [Trichuris suis]